MQRTLLILLGLAVIAFTFTRKRSQPLRGSQKLFGVIAVVCTVLILLQPEFLALGLLGDTAFFEMLVLALSLQMYTYAVQSTRVFVAVLCKSLHWLGIPSPGFSYLLAVLTIGIAGGISTLQKFANRIFS
jgi:uncharacterized membrane protein YkgB